MKDDLLDATIKAIGIVSGIVLLFYVLGSAYAFYNLPCQELKTNYLTRYSYAPTRCIK
jgi:hypothetical protein